jgi:hypothetical protein
MAAGVESPAAAVPEAPLVKETAAAARTAAVRAGRTAEWTMGMALRSRGDMPYNVSRRPAVLKQT